MVTAHPRSLITTVSRWKLSSTYKEDGILHTKAVQFCGHVVYLIHSTQLANIPLARDVYCNGKKNTQKKTKKKQQKNNQTNKQKTNTKTKTKRKKTLVNITWNFYDDNHYTFASYFNELNLIHFYSYRLIIIPI